MVLTVALTIAVATTPALAYKYERADVLFKSKRIDWADWYYESARLKDGEKRPAIVMAKASAP